MRCSMPLLATVCLLAAIAAPAQAQSSANAEICAADDASAFSPEQRIAACTALIEAAKDKPQDLAAALVNRGAAYWYVNKMKAALDDLDRAIALDPKNARAFRERSNANRTSGRLDRALSDANTAVRLDPNDPKAFDFRGNVFNNNRQYDRAIEDYNEALRLDPKYAQAFMDRGVANYFKQDYQAAIKDYDESIKLNPKHARAYTNRGAAYKKLGMDEKALADESEAIKLDPTVPEYFDNRGLSYQKNGDYDRAIADYNEAIRIAPKANFLTNRGDSYQFKGELDRAIADYDRALKLNPGFYLAYNNRGAAFRKKGDLDRAIENYEQALRVNPRFDSAAENLAYVRQERDRRDSVASKSMLPSFDCDAAKRAVEKAICSDPDLIRLDRQIDDAYKAAMSKLDRAGIARLRREQRRFNATRDKSFGHPDYQLKRELERRLTVLRGKAAAD
jgi:tetratricopeptide (TPR) repeat protein